MQKRLFEFLEMNVMFLGDTISSMTITYSNSGMPSVKLDTIAWSLDGVLLYAVIDLNVLKHCVEFHLFI